MRSSGALWSKWTQRCEAATVTTPRGWMQLNCRSCVTLFVQFTPIQSWFFIKNILISVSNNQWLAVLLLNRFTQSCIELQGNLKKVWTHISDWLIVDLADWRLCQTADHAPAAPVSATTSHASQSYLFSILWSECVNKAWDKYFISNTKIYCPPKSCCLS